MRIKFSSAGLKSCHHPLLIIVIFFSGLAWESYYTVALSVVYFVFILVLFWELSFKGAKVAVLPPIVFVIFFVYVFVYSLILFIFGEIPDRSILSSIYFPALLLLSYLILLSDCRRYYLCVVFSLMVFLLSGLRVLLIQADALGESSAYEQTNWTNISVASLSFVFLVKSRMVRMLCLAFGTVVVLVGLKRSGVLVLLMYWIIYFAFLKDFRKERSGALVKLASSVISIIMLYFILSSSHLLKYYEYAMLRMNNILEDGGSGRGRILEAGFSHWIGSEHLFKVSGLGYHAFEREVGLASSMHNDFGELLLSYGFVGLFFLIFIYWRLIYLALSFYRNRMCEAGFSLAIMFAFLIYGSVSGLYFYPLFFTSLVVGYAYLEVRWSQERGLNCKRV